MAIFGRVERVNEGDFGTHRAKNDLSTSSSRSKIAAFFDCGQGLGHTRVFYGLSRGELQAVAVTASMLKPWTRLAGPCGPTPGCAR